MPKPRSSASTTVMPGAAGGREQMPREGLPLVRASDLASWAYCRRAWWLARVQGVAPGDAAPLDAGAAFHAAHGRSLRRALWARRAGIALLIVALLAAVALGLLLLIR